ncbi:MAG: hypothetical protein OXG74_21095 [Acidobacteria bacterium]|nr:hypothetical protein [Acidobacteriota bacterium]
MQVVQVGSSSSAHLVAVRQVSEDDWLLRLHTGPAPLGYKNRPLDPGRSKVLLVAAWDMCTGHYLVHYYVDRGESARSFLGALEAMLSGEGRGARLPMYGCPDDLWSAREPLASSPAAIKLLSRMDVALEFSTRMGGAKRVWRTLWSRFERVLFLREEKRILLSEVRERLVVYLETEMARPARIHVAGRRASRAEAWAALSRARTVPIRRWPDGAAATLSEPFANR